MQITNSSSRPRILNLLLLLAGSMATSVVACDQVEPDDPEAALRGEDLDSGNDEDLVVADEESGDPEPSPVNPDELTAEPRTSRAIGECTRNCQTVELSGTGVKSDTIFCGVGPGHDMTGGGCNIEDGVAANVHLLDSYPSSDNQWTCKVYSSQAGAFDLQT